MRLINCSTLELEEFFNISSDEPEYAILSHTWDEEEVSFQDFVGNPQKRTEMRGWIKIMNTCKQAKEEDINYVWIDTCCIDKTSSSELTEAINSMYKWYASAIVCYAYLQDLDPPDLEASPQREELFQCRWFTRGWTLQELIAPRRIQFYSKEWHLYGTKEGLRSLLSKITGIDEDVLQWAYFGDFLLRRKPACRKMFWAAKRKTKRDEDIAYCLMGIFKVHMPLLYGEGRERAFIRLQEEIMKDSNDLTLFAWKTSHDEDKDSYGIMAHSPSNFRRAGDIEWSQDLSFNPEFQMTNKGVRIHTRLRPDTAGKLKYGYRHSFMSLQCHYSRTPTRTIGIELVQAGALEDHFHRTSKGPTTMKHYDGYLSKASTIYIAKEPFQVSHYYPQGEAKPPGFSPSIIKFEDEFRMGRGETSKWYNGPGSETFVTFKNEISEPANRWVEIGPQSSGIFQTTDTPRFVGLRKFHGVCEFESSKFVVVCGFARGSEAWLCLVTPKSHSNIWEAAEHFDLERVGEMACEVRNNTVNIETDPEQTNLGGGRFHIVASSITKKESYDLEVHVQLKLQMGRCIV